MRLSWNEIRARPARFADEWNAQERCVGFSAYAQGQPGGAASSIEFDTIDFNTIEFNKPASVPV